MEESEEPRIFRPHEVRYYADSEELPSESWSRSLVKIYDRDQGGSLVHQFERNYGDTGPFFPFLKDGSWYALCSPIYDRTMCIRLPDGEVVAECDSAMTIPLFDLDDHELEPSIESICPVSCYVPHLHKLTHDWGENYASRGKSQRHWNTYHEVESDGHEIRRKLPEYFFAADIGFVSGCIWGADMQLEIYALDLSRLHTGVLHFIETGRHMPWKILDVSLVVSVDAEDETGVVSGVEINDTYFHVIRGENGIELQQAPEDFHRRYG